MKTGVVNNKFLVSQIRLDGKFNLSEGLQVRKLVHKSPWGITSINEVTSDIYCPGIFQRHYVSSGIPFLGGADIQKQEINSDKFLRKATTPNWKILEIKRGWTLVTCGGTIGLTAFANNLFTKCWVSQHVMRVIPSSIKEGMLYSYLSSKYGHLLLTTNTYGSVIPTLNADNIGSLPIPLFPESFQAEVDNLIQESARLREEANEKLEEAQNKLSAFIKIKFNKVNFKTSRVNVKEVMSSLRHRIDPPALMSDGVYSMKEVNSKFTCKKICKLKTKVFRPGIFKRIYVEEGIPYIKGSEIFLADPFRRCVHLSKSRTPFVDEMTLHEGQILITCAGSVGDIKIITKDYEDNKAIGSQDIIRLESTDPLYTKEYLFTYLRQPFVYDYIQSMKYGSVIERIEPFHVESIPVVEPTEELSKEITSLIDEYMDCTYHAYTAENKAIKKVEDEIEKWNKAN